MGLIDRILGRSGPKATKPAVSHDRAEWQVEGEGDVAPEVAARVIQFVLRWLDQTENLTEAGRRRLEAINAGDFGEARLQRTDVSVKAAAFLNEYYDDWWAEVGINFLIDPELDFKGSEGLDDLWVKFLEGYQRPRDGADSSEEGKSASDRKSYEAFVADIPNLLEELGILLKASRKFFEVEIRYDDETIGKIEEFYLHVLRGKEKSKVDRDRLEEMLVAYFGEAVIARAENRQAHWALNDCEGTMDFGQPVVTEWALDEGMDVSPMGWLVKLREDKKPFAVDSIQYIASKRNFEKDFFKEFE